MKKIVNKQLWVTKEGEQLSIGLTNAGQEDFGSISFVSLPKLGDKLEAGDSFADIEAEKAVTELITPVSGIVTSINQEAVNDASVLDATNENQAWLIVLSESDEKEFANLV